MKKILLIAGVFVICGAVAALAMGDLFVSGTWRYKMTVTVETPEGLKTGSAVREVSNSTSSVRLDLPEAGNPADLKGEAVVVDLGARGVLFALLKSSGRLGEDYAKSIVHYAFPYSGGYSTAEGIKYYSTLKDEKAVLEPALYPMLVTFTDRNDPKTVRAVLELERYGDGLPDKYRIKADHFEELFGNGVRLKDITIEMTDEPVTWGVVDRYLSEDFWQKFRSWMKSMKLSERDQYIGHFTFKEGD